MLRESNLRMMELERKLEERRIRNQTRIARIYNKLNNTLNVNRSAIIQEANRILSQRGAKKISTLPSVPQVAETLIGDILATIGIHPYQHPVHALYANIFALLQGLPFHGTRMIFVGPSTVDNTTDPKLFKALAFEYSHVVLGHSSLFGSLFGDDQLEADRLANFIGTLAGYTGGELDP